MASEAWAECGRSAIAVAADAAGTGVLDERSCDAVVLRLRGESSGAVESVLRRHIVSDSQLRRCQIQRTLTSSAQEQGSPSLEVSKHC